MPYSDRSDGAAAFMFEGQSLSKSHVSRIIRTLIGKSQSISADVFSGRGCTLVLARADPPRRSKNHIRLQRRQNS